MLNGQQFNGSNADVKKVINYFLTGKPSKSSSLVFGDGWV
jgi:hypothetical protein